MVGVGEKIRYKGKEYEVIEIYINAGGIYYKVIGKDGWERILHEREVRKYA